jgi:hypothetical protein
MVFRGVGSRTRAPEKFKMTLKSEKQTAMTCTSKEKEMYDKFQKERNGKIKQIKMT